nr:polysaccharide pyruvyl transferase family protein [Microbacterium lushaniae]
MLVHYPQLEAGALNGATVYLSQSAGPFRYAPTRMIDRRLGKARAYLARDDRTADLLRRKVNVKRLPDTALLALTTDTTQTVPATPPDALNIGVVARQLSSSRTRQKRYTENVRELVRVTDGELLVQASARGNDDASFYHHFLGGAASRSLVEGTLPGPSRVSVVVSVRLHGAIQSIRNGVPAVHLSYERKGWGAYEDLGLTPFVHNAFDFDVQHVARQLEEIASDPTEYWSRIRRSLTRLTTARNEIISTLGAAST